MKGRVIMKRTLILLAVVIMLLPAAAGAEALSGGWQTAADITLTPERLAPLEATLDGLVGVTYEPVAYLGSQVVAGVNHAYLCRATVVYPGAQPTWTVVVVYEPLEGPAQLLRISDLDLAELTAPLSLD